MVRDSPQERRQLRRFAPELAVSIVLLLAAALIPPQITDPSQAAMVRDGLWIAVVVVQYATGFIVGTWGWAVTSAEHWTERYDLILIIALGESDHLHRRRRQPARQAGRPGRRSAAAALGIVVTAALWWAHFDFIGPAARIALHAAEGTPGWRWPATRTRTSTCR